MTNPTQSCTGTETVPSTIALVNAPVPPPPPVPTGLPTPATGAGQAVGSAAANDNVDPRNIYLGNLHRDNRRIRELLSNSSDTNSSNTQSSGTTSSSESSAYLPIAPYGANRSNDEILGEIQLHLNQQLNNGVITPIVYDESVARNMLVSGYRPVIDATRNYYQYVEANPHFAGLDPNMSYDDFFDLFMRQTEELGLRHSPSHVHLIRREFSLITDEFEGTPGTPLSLALINSLPTMAFNWVAPFMQPLVAARPSLGFGVFGRLLFQFAIAAFRNGLGSLSSPLFTFYDTLVTYRSGSENTIRFSYYMLRWMSEDFLEVFATLQGNVETWMTTAGGVTYALYTVFRLLYFLRNRFVEPSSSSEISSVPRPIRIPGILGIIMNGMDRTFTLFNLTNPESRTRLYSALTSRNILAFGGLTVVSFGFFAYPDVIPFLARNLGTLASRLVDSSNSLFVEAGQLFQLLLEYWNNRPK